MVTKHLNIAYCSFPVAQGGRVQHGGLCYTASWWESKLRGMSDVLWILTNFSKHFITADECCWQEGLVIMAGIGFLCRGIIVEDFRHSSDVSSISNEKVTRFWPMAKFSLDYYFISNHCYVAYTIGPLGGRVNLVLVIQCSLSGPYLDLTPIKFCWLIFPVVI